MFSFEPILGAKGIAKSRGLNDIISISSASCIDLSGDSKNSDRP